MNKNTILKSGLLTLLLSVLILLICSNKDIYNVSNQFIVKCVGSYNESMTSKEKIVDVAQNFFNERDLYENKAIFKTS